MFDPPIEGGVNMIRRALAATWLCLSTASLAMPVSEFLPKAAALEKKGAMALFSKDLPVLKKEMESSMKAAFEEDRSRTKSGLKPTICLADKGKFSLGSNEIMGHLRAIPAGRRGMSVKDAMTGLLRRKYPCSN